MDDQKLKSLIKKLAKDKKIPKNIETMSNDEFVNSVKNTDKNIMQLLDKLGIDSNNVRSSLSKIAEQHKNKISDIINSSVNNKVKMKKIFKLINNDIDKVVEKNKNFVDDDSTIGKRLIIVFKHLLNILFICMFVGGVYFAITNPVRAFYFFIRYTIIHLLIYIFTGSFYLFGSSKKKAAPVKV